MRYIDLVRELQQDGNRVFVQGPARIEVGLADRIAGHLLEAAHDLVHTHPEFSQLTYGDLINGLVAALWWFQFFRALENPHVTVTEPRPAAGEPGGSQGSGGSGEPPVVSRPDGV